MFFHVRFRPESFRPVRERTTRPSLRRSRADVARDRADSPCDLAGCYWTARARSATLSRMSSARPVAVYTGARMAAYRFTRESVPDSRHDFKPARFAFKPARHDFKPTRFAACVRPSRAPPIPRASLPPGSAMFAALLS